MTGVGDAVGARPSDADGWGGGVGAAPGSGARTMIPPMTSAAAATPASETGDDRDPGPHAGAEGTSTDGPSACLSGPRYDARPMAGPTEQIRTRVLPALLTAFGVTLLAAGLLTYTVPVGGGSPVAPTGSPSPEPSIAVAPTPTPLITLPPIGTAPPTPPMRRPHRRPTAWRRGSGSPISTSICRSSRECGLPVLQRGDVPAVALAARLRPGDVPVRARP